MTLNVRVRIPSFILEINRLCEVIGVVLVCNIIYYMVVRFLTLIAVRFLPDVTVRGSRECYCA